MLLVTDKQINTLSKEYKTLFEVYKRHNVIGIGSGSDGMSLEDAAVAVKNLAPKAQARMCSLEERKQHAFAKHGRQPSQPS